MFKEVNKLTVYKIDLTDVQLNNLITFITRTQLTGTEVPAYNELINVFNKILQNSQNK